MRRLRFRIWLIKKLGGDPWGLEDELWDLERPLPTGRPSEWVSMAAMVEHIRHGDHALSPWLEDELMPRLAQ